MYDAFLFEFCRDDLTVQGLWERCIWKMKIRDATGVLRVAMDSLPFSWTISRNVW